jgi:hypothetical protein
MEGSSCPFIQLQKAEHKPVQLFAFGAGLLLLFIGTLSFISKVTNCSQDRK